MTKYFSSRAALAGLCLASAPAHADTALDRLKSDLLGKRSATEVLTAWCADLKLASPAVIRAEKVAGGGALPETRVRALLQVNANDTVRHRRVRLMCGTHLMSEADNWYLPARLTPAMNQALDTTDTSFRHGGVAARFHRRTLSAKTLNSRHTALEIRAILVTQAGMPFSLVVEDYSRDLVAGPR